MNPVNLSNVSADFDTLLSELLTELQSRATWKDFQISSTGTTLLEFAASIGIFNQFNIETSFREAFLATALRDSSIYAIARMLGVNIPRKSAPVLTLELTNNSNSDVYIIPNSVFLNNNTNFFNLNQINIAPGQTQSVAISEGTFTTKLMPIVRQKYYEYFLGELNFVVTEGSIRVYVVNDLTGSEELWTKSNDSIWMLGPFDKKYIETTVESGDVSLIFGDGVNGALLPDNSSLRIDYVKTNGLISTNIVSQRLTYIGNTSVSGTVTEIFESGNNEKPSAYYKYYAPNMFKARNRGISKTDYIAIILNHPDVASVTVHAQRDLYPSDPMWQNVIRVCVLASGSYDTFGGANPNPKSAKWTSFLEWLQPKIGLMKIQTYNPQKILVNINVQVAMFAEANATTVENSIRANLITLFQKDSHSLGKSVYVSDITDACKVQYVDYINLISPTVNSVPSDAYTYVALGTVIITTYFSERTTIPTYSG